MKIEFMFFIKDKIIQASLIIICISMSTKAQEALTLDQAITTGLENNFGIRLAKKNVDIAKNNYSRGNAGFLPSVEVTANQNFTIEDTKQEFIENRTQERDGARSQRFNAEAALQWTIFDGLGMFIRYDRLAELKKSEDFNLKYTIENQVANIIKAYYSVGLEQERTHVLKDNLLFSKRILDVAKSKYEIGKFSRLDYLTAQVDYNSDSSNYLAQTERFKNLKVELNQLIGRSPGTEYDVMHAIDINSTLIQHELLQGMFNQNPLLKQLEAGKAISSLQLQEIRSQRYPVINLNAGYAYGSSSAEAGFLVSRQAFGPTFGVSARINIFDGNNLNRQQQNAQIQVEKANISFDEAKNEMEAALRKAFIQYQNSLALINLEKSNVTVAVEREEIAFERYEIGNSSAIEVREAQLNRLNAEIRYLNVMYNAKVSETELLRLSSIILN